MQTMNPADIESQYPLDGDDDPNEIELAWSKEIERRVKEIREGKAELVTEEEFFRRLTEEDI